MRAKCLSFLSPFLRRRSITITIIVIIIIDRLALIWQTIDSYYYYYWLADWALAADAATAAGCFVLFWRAAGSIVVDVVEATH